MIVLKYIHTQEVANIIILYHYRNGMFYRMGVSAVLREMSTSLFRSSNIVVCFLPVLHWFALATILPCSRPTVKPQPRGVTMTTLALLSLSSLLPSIPVASAFVGQHPHQYYDGHQHKHQYHPTTYNQEKQQRYLYSSSFITDIEEGVLTPTPEDQQLEAWCDTVGIDRRAGIQVLTTPVSVGSRNMFTTQHT